MDPSSLLKINVITNTGVDFVFAAKTTWDISRLTKQIETIYHQITGKDKFVLKGTIKRGHFLVPLKQHVGNIFNDNDEVQCQMIDGEHKNKHQKVKQKRVQKEENNSSHEKKEKREKERREGERVEERVEKKEGKAQDNEHNKNKKPDNEEKLLISEKMLELLKNKNKDEEVRKNEKKAKKNQKSTKQKKDPKIIIKEDSDSE